MNKLQLAFRSLFDRPRTITQSGLSSVFGTNSPAFGLGLGYDFVPLDAAGDIMYMNNKGSGSDPLWRGLDSPSSQAWAYRKCSPLAAVIDKKAESDSNGRIEFVDSDLVTIKNPNKSPRLGRIKSLLANPNPFQTNYEFNSEQIVIANIYGYCPMWAICPEGADKSYTTSLFNLNPENLKSVLNEDFDYYEFDSINNGLVKKWIYKLYDKEYTINASDILLIKDGYITSGAMPLSKLIGLDFFISNLVAALEADNVLLRKKGPLGIFGYDAKPDMAGWTPLTNKGKEEIQNDLSGFGLSNAQKQYAISKVPIKWNPMSFNVQELMTKETVRQGVEGICDRMGFPAELMSGKNATYENRRSAERFLYQSTVIPFSLRTIAWYNKFFQLSDIKLVKDFDHLPVLQEDAVKAGTARKAISEALTLDWNNGIITYNEYREELGMDKIAGMDVYYNEYLKKFPPVMAAKPVKAKTNKNESPAPKN